jgi:hypothetical protein
MGHVIHGNGGDVGMTVKACPTTRMGRPLCGDPVPS